MTSKRAFVRQWRRLQTLSVAFAAINFVTILFYPDALPWLWGGFLPVGMVLIARLRCWKCGERLVKNGGPHIEWNDGGRGLLKWQPSRHKPCGAELS